MSIKVLLLVFHMPMICKSQEYLESSLCILFHKGPLHIIVGLMVLSPIFYICAELCSIGICGHPFIPEGKEHEGSCSLCAIRPAEKMVCLAAKNMVFSW